MAVLADDLTRTVARAPRGQARRLRSPVPAIATRRHGDNAEPAVSAASLVREVFLQIDPRVDRVAGG